MLGASATVSTRVLDQASHLLRAPPLGGGRRRARTRISCEPQPRGGDLEGVPARSLAGRRARREGTREGIHCGGVARGRPHEPTRSRLLSAAVDVPARRCPRPGHRLPGAQAPRRRSTQGEVRQLAGERSLQEEPRPLRPPSRPARDRQAGQGRGRRGEHRRHRATPGGVRAGRRLDGDGADRAAPEGARAADQAPLPLLRRGCCRRGGDVAGHGASARPGIRDPRRHASHGAGPCGCARRLRAAPRTGRELSPLPRSARARPRRRTGRRGSCARGRSSRRAEDSPERQEALRLVADRLDLPRETLSGIAPARGTAAAAPPRRSRKSSSMPASGSSERLWPPSSRIPSSSTRSRGSRRSTSSRGASQDARLARRACPARRRPRAPLRGARRDRVDRGDHAPDRHGDAAAAAGEEAAA